MPALGRLALTHEALEGAERRRRDLAAPVAHVDPELFLESKRVHDVARALPLAVRVVRPAGMVSVWPGLRCAPSLRWLASRIACALT